MKILEGIGRGVIRQLAYVGGLTTQFWSGLTAVPRVLPLIGRRGRWSSAIRQMSAIGVDALPMVAIVSACGGFILAIQSASELSRFGAMQLVIDIVVIAFTRELGPLLTAIVVSGRSGSAFSAEIGTMVVTEEIDALRTMAIDPIELVLTPKYIASMVVVPCLTIMSSVFAILAGAGFMYLSRNMTLPIFLRYAAESVVLRDVVMGLVKSVVFATIIAQVGCMEGFRVSGGPEGVGKSATSAVVKSTFLVIFADLFITTMFYLLGRSSTMADPIISVRDLIVSYGGRRVLDGVQYSTSSRARCWLCLEEAAQAKAPCCGTSLVSSGRTQAGFTSRAWILTTVPRGNAGSPARHGSKFPGLSALQLNDRRGERRTAVA